ncbi:MAG: cytochrome d ubiquinol oxidase subunit II, partial [Vallitaleaceae bacterium]|nr:cytochrome d ubiquinol oxidase subunit II [Vallitaleaceae bacterium]
VWDGNEVWLISAGGAIFAAFPNWYATMFSGFYLALFAILVALIFRAVAFEFRSKVESLKWRKSWDMALFLGSLIPALLWGVAFANLVKGVPIDGDMEYIGNFFNLLSPYTLLAGLTGLAIFIYHGAVYISLKTTGEILKRSQSAAKKVGIAAITLWGLLLIFSLFTLDAVKGLAVITLIIATLAVLVSYYFMLKGKSGKALISNGIGIMAAVASLFIGLFPNVMVSSLNPLFNLTVTNASSSPYTLKVMTFVAITMIPIVLAYQIWSYYVFRKRVTGDKLEY